LPPERDAHHPRLRPRGSSQGGLRQYNERVVLHAVRLHGALAAAELARLTHLTAQTISLITKRLLDEGLLEKGEPVRGKVGQPSVPLALAADGAYAIGVKVGRRSMDVLLVDFAGAVRQRWTTAYAFPEPKKVLAEIRQRLADIETQLGPAGFARVQGVGIAAPLRLGGWQELLGFPAKLAAQWDATDLRAEVAALTALPVSLLKDTAAACVAELVAGRGRSVGSFLYLFVDTFIGGGLVIDSHLRPGPHGNAGAVGSLPLGLAPGGVRSTAAPQQLLAVASLHALEGRYAGAGLDPAASGDARALLAPWLPHTRAWLKEAARAMALAVNSAACLLDLDVVIVDGSFTRELLAALLAELGPAIAHYNWEGVSQPQVLAGTIGSDARAMGGALMPLHAAFAPDRELFLKALDA
jgi:predicted NBD/HSP70 family sugar kinase